MQTFLISPKFEKKYLYKSPTLLYHEFYNAWAYQKMVKLSNPNLPKQQLLEKQIQKTAQIRSELNKENQISQNATAQLYTINEKERAQKKVAEYTTMLDMATDSSIRTHLVNQINTKKQQLLENNIVEKYDSPGRPSCALKNPELYDQLHACVEFAMEENYQQYMSKSCLQTYLLPHHPNSTQAKRHHHPALIRNVVVSRNEMNSHEDGHYCLASVKNARQFAETFPENSIIISQDDKAK
ncbi:hypothetical protein RhiirA5_431037, partial [Rhizophagus irregularis]